MCAGCLFFIGIITKSSIGRFGKLMELMLQKLGLQQLFFAAIATLTSIVIFLFTNIATLMTVGTLTTITMFMTNAMQAATAFLIYNH